MHGQSELFEGFSSRGVISDEILARRVAARDDRAFTMLYERYAARLHAYCWTILRDEAAVQDALQSTWLNALTALRAGRRSAPPRPWLFRIAHNESISIMRRREPALTATATARDAPAPSAEDQALRRERFHQVLADLSALPEHSRGALVLRELGGLTHQEIAVALGTSAGAAKQSIFEARRDLHESAAGRETACGKIRGRISDGDRRTLRARVVRAHLRHCEGCTEFAAEVQERRRVLPALIPPLAPLIADRVLRHVLRSGGGSAAGSAGAGASSGLGATGGGAVTVAGKSAGTVAVGKVLAGAAVAGVAAVTAGVGVHVLDTPQPQRAHVAAPDQIRTGSSRQAVALRGPDAALVTTQKAVSETSARGVPARSRGAQRLKRDARPPGQAKKTPTPTVPTGQVKMPTTPTIPPGQAKKTTTPTIPPGQAKKTTTPTIPPGQAKKTTTPTIPPGQAKKTTTPTAPPGQAKKTTTPTAPPGQAKKTTTPTAPPGQAKKTTTPTAPPGQAKKTTTPTIPPGQANQTTTPTAAHVPGQGEGVASGSAHSAK